MCCPKNKEKYSSFFYINSIYSQLGKGKELNSLHLPRAVVPDGKYKFILNIDKDAKLPLVPCKLIAYPIYEFLPMVNLFYLIMAVSCFAALLATFLLIRWKKEKSPPGYNN
ncbi:MAG: hypothetical protein GY750_20555 [Lentisphaerae bacterium]|nr:hypothetical protein [Lentisphaerota bacterium]MCP4103784.1 hypothetical protein [Lentisphaerota bacterium]